MEEEKDVEVEPELEVDRSDLFTKGENEDPELEERGVEGKLAKVREELKACRQEKQEYMDGWQRAKADYVNLLKRAEEDAKASEVKGKVKAVETLLPAFDALERAKEHGEIPEGFMAIAKQLENAFAALGLDEVGKAGEQFDPALHEALAQDVVDSAETDGMVTVVLEKGWRVNGNIIRPAKVRVGHFKG